MDTGSCTPDHSGGQTQRCRRQRDVTLREKALCSLDEGYSARQVADMFGITERTLTNWRKRVSETGSLHPKSRNGRPHALCSEEEELILGIWRQDRTLSNIQLAALCSAHLGKKIGARTLSHIFLRQGLRRRSRTQVVSASGDKEVQVWSFCCDSLLHLIMFQNDITPSWSAFSLLACSFYSV